MIKRSGKFWGNFLSGRGGGSYFHRVWRDFQTLNLKSSDYRRGQIWVWAKSFGMKFEPYHVKPPRRCGIWIPNTIDSVEMGRFSFLFSYLLHTICCAVVPLNR